MFNFELWKFIHNSKLKTKNNLKVRNLKTKKPPALFYNKCKGLLCGEYLKLEKKTKDTWYYVVVQNPETSSEQFMGYTDKETNATFIPCFKSKKIGQQCFLLMPKDIMNDKYEVQAIIKEDLIILAEKQSYEIFLLDDKGKILEQIS
jgi:hypothetical protein